MKTSHHKIAALVGALALATCWASSGCAVEETHDPLVDILVKAHISEVRKNKWVPDSWHTDNWFEGVVRKNIAKTVVHFRAVHRDAISTTVTRTSDTDSLVVTLHTADGRSASLWYRREGFPDISPY